MFCMKNVSSSEVSVFRSKNEHLKFRKNGAKMSKLFFEIK